MYLERIHPFLVPFPAPFFTPRECPDPSTPSPLPFDFFTNPISPCLLSWISRCTSHLPSLSFQSLKSLSSLIGILRFFSSKISSVGLDFVGICIDSVRGVGGQLRLAAALNKMERAHQMYREGQHEDALGLYTEAFAMAKTKAQKVALHSNRAACYLKLHDFNKAAEECTSVLELDHQHTGALMLRVQTSVTLKDYQSALFDINRLMELNPSSDVYRNLQARLRTLLSLAPIPESEEEALYLEEDEESLLKRDAKSEPPSSNPKVPLPLTWNLVVPADTLSKPKGWEAIPKPKGHSALDYSRWDRVVDDSSEEEEEDAEEQQPHYRFHVKTVVVWPVK